MFKVGEAEERVRIESLRMQLCMTSISPEVIAELCLRSVVAGPHVRQETSAHIPDAGGPHGSKQYPEIAAPHR